MLDQHTLFCCCLFVGWTFRIKYEVGFVISDSAGQILFMNTISELPNAPMVKYLNVFEAAAKHNGYWINIHCSAVVSL